MEEKLCGKGPGSTVNDENHHIVSILRKKPSRLINPDCDIWLSAQTMRTNRGKEVQTVSHLTNHLLQLKINIIDNRNIKCKQLSRRGLHLNISGCNQLAKDFLAKMKKF